MKTVLKSVVAATLFAGLATPGLAAGDKIRELSILSRPQAAQPQEFQFVQLIAQEWRKLGLDVKVEVMPWEQMADLVWYNRDTWDMTGWQMVGRPERSDPDEIIYNLFHSTTAADGYNFVGYSNPAFDEVTEAQRVETDEAKRKDLIYQAQEILAADQPNVMLAHPFNTFAYDKTVWNPDSVVEQGGIGIRNTWTFISIEPSGEQKDVILNSSDNIQAINPLFISGATDSWITELVWDRLLRIGPDGLPQPWAAESFEWVDGTTIDVTLRPDMAWHDGEPVSAEDVKFSFEAAMGQEAPMYQPFVGNIESIETTDDRTVRFNLTTPAAAFTTGTLAKLNLIPKHVWEPILADLATKEENAESYQEEAPVGSGPYRFASWTTNEEVVLEANQDHFSPPKAERWILRIVPNTEAALGMLRSGEINFLADFTGDPKILEDMAAEDGDLEIVKTTDIGFRYIAFNNRRPPFDDPAFRQALSTAINRDLIVGAAFKGNAVKSNSVVSPALGFWHNEETVNMKTGLEAAQAILAEAGYEVVGGELHYPDGQSETLAE
ncbi:MAG: ABC transporter substrate-binding protein [Geminicoccaceae bacterium]